MKLLFLLIHILVIFPLSASSQFAQTLISKIWQQTTGTPDTIDWSGSTVDSKRNYIVTGNTIVTNQKTNILTIKYHSDGTVAWEKKYNHSYNDMDYGVAVKTDNQDNVYIAGTCITSATNYYDFILIKYDSTGNLQWTKFYNGPGSFIDVPTDLAIDASGSIYVTGASYGSGTLSDYCTIKYNSSGTQQWVARYDYTLLTEIPVAININSTGKIVVTGGSANSLTDWDYATIRYNPTTGAQINAVRNTSNGLGFDIATSIARDQSDNYFITGATASSSNGYNIKTIKLDSNLNVVWQKNFDGQGLEDRGNSIGLDASGNVYVTGFSRKTNGGTNYVTIKYSAAGTSQWVRHYMAPNELDTAEANKISIDPYGNVYVTGKVKRNGNFDIGTIAYDQDGNLRLEKFFNGAVNGNDIGSFVKVVDGKSLFVTGKSATVSGFEYVSLKYEIYSKQNEIAYDNSTGKPLFIKNEIIIRVDPSKVATNKVDNVDVQFGDPDLLLDDDVVKLIEGALGITFSREHIIKIFHNLTSESVHSVSRLGELVPVPEFWACFILELPVTLDELEACDNLKGLFPTVRYAHVNRVGTFQSPNDPLYANSQQSLHPVAPYDKADINVEPAWNHTTKGKSFVTVGLCDAGIFWQHEDFSKDGSNTWNQSKVRGYDYDSHVSIENVAPDPDFHGTQGAGVIGAISNNNKGIAGIAGGDASMGNYGVKLFSMKVSSITIANSANAIVEAATNDTLNDYGYAVQVQNHAWGFDTAGGYFFEYLDSVLLLRDAARYAFQNQVVMVAARGNEGNYNKSFPACYYDDWILNTGACGDDGEIKQGTDCSSNKGGDVDFIASGSEDMITTTDGGQQNSYVFFRCTSSATAHVSGISALMLSYANDSLSVETNLAPEDVEHILQYTAEDRGISPNGALLEGYDDLTGWGMINAGNALLKIRNPKYRLLHYKTESDTAQKILFLTAETINLKEDFNNIPAGVYTADIFRIFDTVYHSLSTNDTIINGWIRNSSSDFWDYENYYVTPEIQDSIEKITKQYSIVSGFYFKIVSGTYNGTYLPFNPASVSGEMAFTLWVNDTSMVDSFTHVLQPENQVGISIGVFPNPTSDNFEITYELSSTSYTELRLFDMYGGLIKLLQPSMLKTKGNCSMMVSLSDLPSCVYFVCLKTEFGCSTKKIVLIKN